MIFSPAGHGVITNTVGDGSSSTQLEDVLTTEDEEEGRSFHFFSL